jgi:hypothetical protein
LEGGTRVSYCSARAREGEKRKASSHDGSEEVLKVVASSELDVSDLLLHLLSPSGPLGPRDVDSSKSRALLTRVLESGSDRLGDGVLDVGRLVDQVEVLSTGLTDDSGVRSIEVDVVGDLLPEALENGEVLVVGALLDNGGGVSL